MIIDWTSPDPPSPELCVLRELLRRRATETPDGVQVVFEDGTSWTHQQAWEAACGVAHGLYRRGVRKGDRVLTWMPNGPEALRLWYGINLVGAIYVPLNTGYRGTLLEHAVRLSGARVLVGDGALVDRLGPLGQELEQVLTLGPGDWAPAEPDPAAWQTPLDSWDPYAIIYTSGTTGPSKGVLVSYAQVGTCGDVFFDGFFDPGDRYLINSPLFHAASTNGIYASLMHHGSFALVDRFDTTTFWDTVRRFETTHTTLLGVMATFLTKQPPTPRDRQHPLKHAFVVPLVDDLDAFIERFGVSVSGMYNMTETSVPTVTEANPTTKGTCGRVRPGVEVRLVDDHDRPVAEGRPGEMVVRTTTPWAMTTEYYGMPEATARVWRNGWFHTGDCLREVGGEFFFVDRRKDAIRRRGENISSFEVEAEFCAHPAVRECAAIPVPSPFGEDDVMVVVAPVDGAEVDPEELVEFARERMAHFMIPRYVRVVPALPKTPTNKIEKHRLRGEGVTEDTWDREAAGVRVQRESLQR